MRHAELMATRLCVADNVRRAARSVTQRYDRALRDEGLRVGQFALLAAAAQLEASYPEGIMLSTLADHLLLDRTTLARNLKPLERDGWIHSVVGTDQRQRLIRLTPAGRRKLEAAHTRWRDVQTRLVDHFGAERWNDLRAALHELATLP